MKKRRDKMTNLPTWFNNYLQKDKVFFKTNKILKYFSNSNLLLTGKNTKEKRAFIYDMTMAIKQEDEYLKDIEYINFNNDMEQYKKAEDEFYDFMDKHSYPGSMCEEENREIKKSHDYYQKINDKLHSDFLIVDNVKNLDNITKQHAFTYDIGKKRAAYNKKGYITFVILDTTLDRLVEEIEDEMLKNHCPFYLSFFQTLDFG